jgi:adenine-specific DNA-methyltransferase
MVNYKCKQCGKIFYQKIQYNSHNKCKISCITNDNIIKTFVDKTIEKKEELNNNKLIVNSKNIIALKIDKDLQEFIKCDVFTPDNISKIMASKLKNSGNILEPSVGIGNLLKYINFKNYDFIDVYELKKDYLDIIPNNEKINIYNCDFIMKNINISYDNIIMNPPYIKMQDLSVNYREYLKQNFNILKNGIIDIYYAFIIKCLNLLKNDGIMVAITPNSYLYNKSSLNLRKYLFNNKYIKEIIDYNDKKIFKNVSVYCCITIFTKTDKKYITYNNKKILYTDIIKNYSLFNTSNNNNVTLKDICKIKNGIATLRDKIYIHKKKLYDEPCWKKITNGNTERFIIYPYNKGIIINEDIFKQENPLTYNYLFTNKDELSKRDKGKKKYIKWYSYGRTQSLKYSEKKCIYIPCFLNPDLINEKILIKKNILHSGCLCIEPNNEADIQKIVNCIINNKDFIKKNSPKRSGGWINLSSRILYILTLK